MKHARKRLSTRRHLPILLALLTIGWATSSWEVTRRACLAQERYGERGPDCEEPTESEPGRLRLTSASAPWPRWAPSATACAGVGFVAAKHVYVSRDGRRWRHARRGLPARYVAADVACVDDTAYMVGYPALIARWEPRSRRWVVEHVASVETQVPVYSWPVDPRIVRIVREGTSDGLRLRALGSEGPHTPMELVRRPDGSWERVTPWPEDTSIEPHHCENGAAWVRPDGGFELCPGRPQRVLLWRTPIPAGGPWPEPEEILLPPPPPDSAYSGAGWSPNGVLAFGPRIHERPWRDQDRPWTHHYVTLRRDGAWRRALVRGFVGVAGPVELGSSMFIFTSHRIYRVVEPRSRRRDRRR